MREWLMASRFVAVAVLCLVWFPCAKGESPETSQAHEYLRKLDQPVLLRGDYFKAALVAYSDFLQVLAMNAALVNTEGAPDSNAPVPLRNNGLYAKLSKIENFDINIEQSDSYYTVQIGPTLRGDMPLVFGGGVRYQIDKSTFSIKSKTPLK
jgi:hypothetical protein